MEKKMKNKTSKYEKKIDNILTVIIILLVGLIGGILLDKLIVRKDVISSSKEDDITSIYDIEPIVKEYSSINNSKVYLYNTNEVRIKDEGEYITLREYLNKYSLKDTLLNNLELVNTLNDGGTKIYKTKEKSIFDRDLTIIMCHTTEGNEDLYFAQYIDTALAFKNGACGKKTINDKEFSRIYLIKKIKLVEDNLYELTIYDEDNKVETTIKRTMSEDSRNILKENAKFTFYFENKYGDTIKDSIEDIFQNATLKGVVPYNK